MAQGKALTIKNLTLIFGCSHMSILNWSAGIASKTKFPASRTPSAVRAWAARNEMKMLKDPDKLLAVQQGTRPGPKAGPKKLVTRAPVKRNAAGKLSSVRATVASASRPRRAAPSHASAANSQR